MNPPRHERPIEIQTWRIGRRIAGHVNQVWKLLIEISGEGRLRSRGIGRIMTLPEAMAIGMLLEIRIESVRILEVVIEPYFQVWQCEWKLEDVSCEEVMKQILAKEEDLGFS
jgi:hypothetical protein